MSRPSKRFTPNVLTERVVPIIIALITLGLVLTLAIVLLAATGLLPSW